MQLPPFELVYQQHRDELYGFLRSRLPHDDAADAFQDTVLRALRTYPGLEHGRELRGWLYTIARSVIVDRTRRAESRPQSVGSDELCDASATDAARSDPAALLAQAAGLEALADRLPRTERSAVILRYGFDMTYTQIGDALGGSPDAARQAASSGVRRLRAELVTAPDTTTEVDDGTGSC